MKSDYYSLFNRYFHIIFLLWTLQEISFNLLLIHFRVKSKGSTLYGAVCVFVSTHPSRTVHTVNSEQSPTRPSPLIELYVLYPSVDPDYRYIRPACPFCIYSTTIPNSIVPKYGFEYDTHLELFIHLWRRVTLPPVSCVPWSVNQSFDRSCLSTTYPVDWFKSKYWCCCWFSPFFRPPTY